MMVFAVTFDDKKTDMTIMITRALALMSRAFIFIHLITQEDFSWIERC